jgi:hypothetical protein
MKQKLVPGQEMDFLTLNELKGLLVPTYRHRVRATGMVVLDATGSGIIELYTVPLGMEFRARRVMVNLNTATDPSTGNVPLNVGGKYVAYQRSGTLISYGIPLSPNAIPQVPGVETWGEEQGPYTQNGEVFEVAAKGLTAAATFEAVVEGVLTDPKHKYA